MKPVLTGSMTDLQVKGGEFCRVLEGGGGGYPPLLIGLAAGLQVFDSWLTRADLDSWFTGVAGMFCHSGGVGGIPYVQAFFVKKKRPTLIFARKQILSHPIGWIDCHAKVVQGRNESV